MSSDTAGGLRLCRWSGATGAASPAPPLLRHAARISEALSGRKPEAISGPQAPPNQEWQRASLPAPHSAASPPRPDLALPPPPRKPLTRPALRTSSAPGLTCAGTSGVSVPIARPPSPCGDDVHSGATRGRPKLASFPAAETRDSPAAKVFCFRAADAPSFFLGAEASCSPTEWILLLPAADVLFSPAAEPPTAPTSALRARGDACGEIPVGPSGDTAEGGAPPCVQGRHVYESACSAAVRSRPAHSPWHHL